MRVAIHFSLFEIFSPITTYEPHLPDGWVWDNYITMHYFGYHPHARYGIRSKKRSKTSSGAQAMYDADGKLITGGLRACAKNP
jgi:hypothetical protein